MPAAASPPLRPFTALRTLLATTALCGTLSAALPGAAQALPTGGRVVEGQATVSSGATGQIGLVADTLTLDGTVDGGAQGSVTLAPRTLSRSIGIGIGAGDYAVTTALPDKVTGGGHLVVGLPTATGPITVAGTDPVGDEGPIGLNFGRATTLRGGTTALETPVVAPSLALLAGSAITHATGSAITHATGATITSQGTLVLGRSSGIRPTMNLGSAVSAGGDLWLYADTLTIGSAVSAAGTILADVNGTGALTVGSGGSLAATGTNGAPWLRAGSGGMEIAGTVTAAGTSGMSLLSSGTMTVDGTVEASAGLLHVEGTGQIVTPAGFRFDTAGTNVSVSHAGAHLVADVLTRRHGFEVDVQLDRTRNEIFDALRTLGRKLKEEDRIATHYAGHGYSFYGSDLADWLPVDAETTRANAWISSADISKLPHRMPARQILPIPDSCYSGGFAEAIPEGSRSDDLQALLAARAVMTVPSGGDEPVEDGAGNSPFARTRADELEGAPSAMNMLRLFERVRDRVMAESPQTPNHGVVSFAGYDGGADFVLTRR